MRREILTLCCTLLLGATASVWAQNECPVARPHSGHDGGTCKTDTSRIWPYNVYAYCTQDEYTPGSCEGTGSNKECRTRNGTRSKDTWSPNISNSCNANLGGGCTITSSTAIAEVNAYNSNEDCGAGG